MNKRGRKTDLLEESAALLTVAALRLGEHEVAATEGSPIVIEAIRRSTSRLGPSASIGEVAEYVQEFGDDQLPGFINNIKGITFELTYAEAENTDGDAVRADLHDDVNHPDSDVILIDDDTGEVHDVQLKATDNSSYALAAHFDHPDIPVVATSEVAGEIDGIADGGVSNADLTDQVEDTLEDIQNSGILTHAAAGGGLVAGIRAAPVVHACIKGRIDKKTALKLVVERSGLSAAMSAALIVALHSPLAPAAGAYIFYRLIRKGAEVVRENLQPMEKEPCSENS